MSTVLMMVLRMVQLVLHADCSYDGVPCRWCLGFIYLEIRYLFIYYLFFILVYNQHNL